MNYQEAKSDVYEYLNAKDDDYFAERGRTKTDVLNDEDLIEEILLTKILILLRMIMFLNWLKIIPVIRNLYMIL